MTLGPNSYTNQLADSLEKAAAECDEHGFTCRLISPTDSYQPGGRLQALARAAVAQLRQCGPSLPELKESLDFNRLYAGDHRALYADHQAHFDAHYDALKAAEFVTWMEGHAPHTLKNLLKMYKRSDATSHPTTQEKS